jgi:magnesium transporter
VVTCRLYRDEELEHEAPFDRGEVDAAIRSGGWVWLDVIEPTPEELGQLQEAFSLHELSVEDSLRWGQRSKIEFYSGYVFLVLHALSLDERDELVDREFHLFAGRDGWVITVRREPLFAIDRVAARVSTEPDMKREGIGFALYVIVDEVVDGYLDCVERFEDLSDDLEGSVFAEDGEGTVQEDIFHLKRKVVTFRRLALPSREVIDLLTESGGVVTPALRPYYRDVMDHVIRAGELIDNIRELLTTALESQLAQVSNRQNVVMKQLSAWAAIILIPTLIAGIYGMNFRNMPELDWEFGYPFAIGTMLVAAGTLYVVFKRKGWL